MSARALLVPPQVEESPFPRLPLELEHKIFETAAYAHGNAVRLCLILVAHRVRLWIEPLLYTYLQFRRGPWHRIDSFLFTLHAKSCQPSFEAFFARHVKSLLIPSIYVSRSQSLALLQRCAGVQNLALWARYDDRYTLDALAALDLKRLSLLSCMAGPYLNSINELGKPSTLTHLDISCALPAAEDVSLLTSLTHLAYTFDPSSFPSTGTAVSSFPEAVSPLLDALPSLKVLMVIAESTEDLALLKRLPLDDPRIVLLEDIWWPGEWDHLEEGGEDAWALAEQMAVAKRAKALSSD